MNLIAISVRRLARALSGANVERHARAHRQLSIVELQRDVSFCTRIGIDLGSAPITRNCPPSIAPERILAAALPISWIVLGVRASGWREHLGLLIADLARNRTN